MWLPHVTVAAVIEREGKFLLVEERSDSRIVLNQPAGHWDEGEKLIDAVVRETFEESGWEFTPSRIVGIYHWKSANNDTTYLRFAFAGTLGEQRAPGPIDRDILGVRWLTYNEVTACASTHRSPLILRCIDDYRAGRSFDLNAIQSVT